MKNGYIPLSMFTSLPGSIDQNNSLLLSLPKKKVSHFQTVLNAAASLRVMRGLYKKGCKETFICVIQYQEIHHLMLAYGIKYTCICALQ